MTNQDRQEQLKRDIEAFEAWCQRVQEKGTDERDVQGYFEEMCVCGHPRSSHRLGNDDWPESPCQATIHSRVDEINRVIVMRPCDCDDFEAEEPFKDREAWEHRYGQ